MNLPASIPLASLLQAVAATGALPGGLGETYLDVSDLQARYRVGRSTIWNWSADPDFPRPIRLSGKCTRWRLSDLTAWEARRAAEAA